MTGKASRYVWPVIGVCAVALSAWLLNKELRGLSFADVATSLEAIPARNWVLAVIATLVAYGALAGYDRLALIHLAKPVSWRFVTLTSFTAYALGHNIGFSVLSGALVRYRAYTSRGLSAAEVGVLVAFCTGTFVLGTLLLGGLLLVADPTFILRFVDVSPWIGFAAGLAMLGLVLFYVIGSLFHLKPFAIGTFHVTYPRPPVVARQLVLAPVEIIAAAGIIYFALPAAGNPGFIEVLAIFLTSFSVALVSHAPGGIGVLEVVFLAGLSEMDQADVLAALIIFRLFYLLVPLALSLIVVLFFERQQLRNR